MSEAGVTYDVTAVSHDGQHVPLTAGTSYSTAIEIARPCSMDGTWAMVQVRDSNTREVVAVYVGGSEAPYLTSAQRAKSDT
jgi:hypothetical protein